jgi:hypothetical protein
MCDHARDSRGTVELHGHLMQSGLAETPRNYSALTWSLVQVIAREHGALGVPVTGLLGQLRGRARIATNRGG